ncbi:ATP-dependent DNA ligase [Gordonia crocea]|uniref:DNA ligase (ATP) n=1 Tax=Gordonia crocea TaxID=589162 RepID=A0A7I9V0M4_9ACTN|nr:ATP-dependent DNA ligase [Gordonia crocea]GED96483.1 DNA ligase C1 [Gordonia crocea]GED98649.1 DNA ligase C1 [Gordonia crocea]
MDLPVNPPVAPMLAKAVAAVPPQPDGESVWLYEPKWDGFRVLVFRDGDEVEMVSRGGKDLARYFPEVVEAVRRELPDKVVLDGEIGVPRAFGDVHRLDWDALSQRIHPAKSRIDMLAEQTPAIVIGFDALALGPADLMSEPFEVRRAALVAAVGSNGTASSIRASRVTADTGVAQRWFSAFEGAGLDGIVAKDRAGVYVPGKREMLKVKHKRTADCVITGYRVHRSGTGVGSLLLGLYGDDGELRMVGGSSAFSDAKRVELQTLLEPMRPDADTPHPGELTRWRHAGSGEFFPVNQELVAEFAYDQMENGRFRHTVKFLRWRPDREPDSCRYDQLEVPLSYDLYAVLEDA